jgi:hypothetical protein
MAKQTNPARIAEIKFKISDIDMDLQFSELTPDEREHLENQKEKLDEELSQYEKVNTRYTQKPQFV